jgi:hypothetical protein
VQYQLLRNQEDYLVPAWHNLQLLLQAAYLAGLQHQHSLRQVVCFLKQQSKQAVFSRTPQHHPAPASSPTPLHHSQRLVGCSQAPSLLVVFLPILRRKHRSQHRQAVSSAL